MTFHILGTYICISHIFYSMKMEFEIGILLILMFYLIFIPSTYIDEIKTKILCQFPFIFDENKNIYIGTSISPLKI